MTTLTPAEPVPPRTRPARLLTAAMTGGVLAALVNTTLLVAGKAFGVAFLAPIGGPGAPLETIQATNVVIMSLVPALGAGLLLALLRRVTRRPSPIFLAIAGALLLASLFPGWVLPMDSVAKRTLLSAMHLVAGIMITGALLRARPS